MDEITYQRALRVLGTRFDQAHAEEIRIMELNHTLEIRSRSISDCSPSNHEILTAARLTELEEDQVEARETGTPAGRYRDVLRTVGWELDQVGARSILLDEHDEGMLVTFQFLVPSDGFLPHKTVWHVTGEHQKAILGRAHARRHIEMPDQKRRLRDFFA